MNKRRISSIESNTLISDSLESSQCLESGTLNHAMKFNVTNGDNDSTKSDSNGTKECIKSTTIKSDSIGKIVVKCECNNERKSTKNHSCRCDSNGGFATEDSNGEINATKSDSNGRKHSSDSNGKLRLDKRRNKWSKDNKSVKTEIKEVKKLDILLCEVYVVDSNVDTKDDTKESKEVDEVVSIVDIHEPNFKFIDDMSSINLGGVKLNEVTITNSIE